MSRGRTPGLQSRHHTPAVRKDRIRHGWPIERALTTPVKERKVSRMARLAAEAKLCYYPAAPEAIVGILQHLYLSDKSKPCTIIDPCCGKGAALKQLADGLGFPEEDVYGVELDKGRADEARLRMPRANILGPCSFLGAHVSGYSFSLAYVNAPYGDEIGGGKREELSFVSRATHLLAAGGVLCTVWPVSKLLGNRNAIEYIDSYYDNVQLYRFPDGHRQYGEICLFGRKRKVELSCDARRSSAYSISGAGSRNSLHEGRGSPAARRCTAEFLAWQPAKLGPA